MKVHYETIVDVIKRKTEQAVLEGGRHIKSVLLSADEWRELSKEFGLSPQVTRTSLRVAIPSGIETSLLRTSSATVNPPMVADVIVKKEAQTHRDF